MAESITPRFGFKKQSAGTDAWPGRVGFMEILDLIEATGAQFSQGTYGARPAAGEAGRFYWATTLGTPPGTLLYDNGTEWVDTTRLSVVDGFPGAVAPWRLGNGPQIGSSNLAARADHSHPYSWGYVKNRMPLMWGGSIGPGLFSNTHSDVLDSEAIGAVLVGGGEFQNSAVQIPRAGVYRLTACVHIDGYSDGASPWRTNAMDLCILKNSNTGGILDNTMEAVPSVNPLNIRHKSITFAARLAVDDFVMTGIYLHSNIGTSSGTATNAYTYITAEMI